MRVVLNRKFLFIPNGEINWINLLKIQKYTYAYLYKSLDFSGLEDDTYIMVTYITVCSVG